MATTFRFVVLRLGVLLVLLLVHLLLMGLLLVRLPVALVRRRMRGLPIALSTSAFI